VGDTRRLSRDLADRVWMKAHGQLLPLKGASRIRRQYQTYVKVAGEWCYLYRAIDRDGNLVDVYLSETRDMAAAKAFLRSAKSVTQIRARAGHH
jgi:hypothetical protein